MMKKTTVFLLAVAILFSLAACGPAENDPADPTPENTSGTTGGTTHATTTEDPTSSIIPESEILLSALKDYVIVRPDKATYKTLDAVTALKNALAEIGSEYKLDVHSDLIVEGFPQFQERELEILLGDTNRDESIAFRKKLRYRDYGYSVIGEKIVIFGYTDETLAMAVERFVDDVVDGLDAESKIFMSRQDERVVKGDYPVNRVAINGHLLKNCALVYADGSETEQYLAQSLQTYFAETVGYWIPVYSDGTAKASETYEILIGGATDREEHIPADLAEGEIYIAAEEDCAVLAGKTPSDLYSAVTCFKQMFVSGDHTIELAIEEPIRRTCEDAKLRVMSFNVQSWDYTEQRGTGALKVLSNFAPDVFGIQEGTPTWNYVFKQGLLEYGYVGGSRGDASEEYCSIFYLKTKYDLLESGTRWLSETPDIVGSKYSDSAYIRIMTYAVLQRKSDGMIFVHVNTHLDTNGEAVRTKQAQRMFELLNEIEYVKQGYPLIVTGDFNAAVNSQTYNYMLSKGCADSSSLAEKVTSSGGTYHGYRDEPATAVIDFVFVKAKNCAVSRYHVCNELIDGAYVSDHHPVYAEICLT